MSRPVPNDPGGHGSAKDAEFVSWPLSPDSSHPCATISAQRHAIAFDGFDKVRPFCAVGRTRNGLRRTELPHWPVCEWDTSSRVPWRTCSSWETTKRGGGTSGRNTLALPRAGGSSTSCSTACAKRIARLGTLKLGVTTGSISSCDGSNVLDGAKEKEAQAPLLVRVLFETHSRVSQAANTCSSARLLATKIGEQDLDIVLDLLRQQVLEKILAADARRKRPSQFLWSLQCSQLFLLFHQVIEGVDANTAGPSVHSRRHGGARHDRLTTGALSYNGQLRGSWKAVRQPSTSRKSTAAGQSERSSIESAPFPDTLLHGQLRCDLLTALRENPSQCRGILGIHTGTSALCTALCCIGHAVLEFAPERGAAKWMWLCCCAVQRKTCCSAALLSRTVRCGMACLALSLILRRVSLLTSQLFRSLPQPCCGIPQIRTVQIWNTPLPSHANRQLVIHSLSLISQSKHRTRCFTVKRHQSLSDCTIFSPATLVENRQLRQQTCVSFLISTVQAQQHGKHWKRASRTGGGFGLGGMSNTSATGTTLRHALQSESRRIRSSCVQRISLQNMTGRRI